MNRRQSGAPRVMSLSAGLVLACGPTGWAADAELGAPPGPLVQPALQEHAVPVERAETWHPGRSHGTEGERVDLAASEIRQVKVRVGNHGESNGSRSNGRSRSNTTWRSAEQVTIEFSRPGRIDVSRIANRLRRVVDASADNGDATARVTLRLLPDARVRSFNLKDGRVAFDLFGGTAVQSLASPEPDPGHDTLEGLRRALEQRDAVIENLLARFEQLAARFEQLERTVALSSGDLDRVTAGQAGPMPWVGDTPRPRPRSLAIGGSR